MSAMRAMTSAMLLVSVACVAGCSDSQPLPIAPELPDGWSLDTSLTYTLPAGAAADTATTYSWPYTYAPGDPFFVEADSEQATHTYVKRDGQWYVQDGLSDYPWPVAAGLAKVGRRPDLSVATVLERHSEFGLDTVMARSRPRRYTDVRYPKDIDPVRVLKNIEATGMFTVGWLNTYGLRTDP